MARVGASMEHVLAATCSMVAGLPTSHERANPTHQKSNCALILAMRAAMIEVGYSQLVPNVC